MGRTKEKEKEKERAVSPAELMRIVQRGIAGHLTYSSAVAAWGSTSELSLYPAVSAIMFARGWVPFCQYQLLDGMAGRRGAKKTIDFVASLRTNKQDQLAVEIKLIASRTKNRT